MRGTLLPLFWTRSYNGRPFLSSQINSPITEFMCSITSSFSPNCVTSVPAKLELIADKAAVSTHFPDSLVFSVALSTSLGRLFDPRLIDLGTNRHKIKRINSVITWRHTCCWHFVVSCITSTLGDKNLFRIRFRYFKFYRATIQANRQHVLISRFPVDWIRWMEDIVPRTFCVKIAQTEFGTRRRAVFPRKLCGKVAT